MKKSTRGSTELTILIVIAVLGLLLAGGLFQVKQDPNRQVGVGTPFSPSVPADKTLQLKTLQFSPDIPTEPPITPPPPLTTGTYCQTDNARTNGCVCAPSESNGVICENKTVDDTQPYGNPVNGRCPDQGIDCAFWNRINLIGLNIYNRWGCDGKSCLYIQHPSPGYKTSSTAYNKYINQCNDKQICFGKPVINLYVDTPTVVNVKLTIPGKITQSDPLYPKLGWQHILVLPGSILHYNAKQYHELFYETQIGAIHPPDNGLIIPKEKVKENLFMITKQLGLIPSEQQEFVDYWMPQLENVQTSYLLISLLDPAEKEQVDHVDITPQPRTKIEFLLYFKGVATSQTSLPALPLPQYPPQRNGFTVVEWGAAIAS